jgi:hypothetical protein
VEPPAKGPINFPPEVPEEEHESVDDVAEALDISAGPILYHLPDDPASFSNNFGVSENDESEESF